MKLQAVSLIDQNLCQNLKMFNMLSKVSPLFGFNLFEPTTAGRYLLQNGSMRDASSLRMHFSLAPTSANRFFVIHALFSSSFLS